MRYKTFVLLTVVAASLLSTGVRADDHEQGADYEDRPARHHRGMPPIEKRVKRMAKQLELDELQREQITNIMSAAQPEFDALHEQRKSNREAMKTLSADNSQVQEIAASNGELATQATLLKARVRSEIDAVLTDEQREKLASFEAQRSDRSQRRRGRRSNDT